MPSTHDHNSDSEDDNVLSFDSDTQAAPPPDLTPPTSHTPDITYTAPHRSSHSRVLTKAGQAFADEVAASRLRRNSHALKGVPAEEGLVPIPEDPVIEEDLTHNAVTYTRMRRTAKGDNVPIQTGQPTWAHGNNCTMIDKWAEGVYDGDEWAGK
ncbi:hypothetical protein EDB19DRAFT_1835338 [Suillus lakei]|nr:hypothetical protein EDB19DRAFT_1835338 [Suillus lakei]